MRPKFHKHIIVMGQHGYTQQFFCELGTISMVGNLVLGKEHEPT